MMNVTFVPCSPEESSQFVERGSYPSFSVENYFSNPVGTLSTLKGKHIVAFKMAGTEHVWFFIKTAAVAKVVLNAPRYGIKEQGHPFGAGHLTAILRAAMAVDASQGAGTNNVMTTSSEKHEQLRAPLRRCFIRDLHTYTPRITRCIASLIPKGNIDINSFCRDFLQQTILDLLGLPPDTVTMEEIAQLNGLAHKWVVAKVPGAEEEMKALRQSIDAKVIAGLQNLRKDSIFAFLLQNGYDDLICRETVIALMIGARNGSTALIHLIWKLSRDNELQIEIRKNGIPKDLFQRSLQEHSPVRTMTRNVINSMKLTVEDESYGFLPGDVIHYLVSDMHFGVGPNRCPAAFLIDFIATKSMELLVSNFVLSCDIEALGILPNVFTNEFNNDPIPVRMISLSIQALLNDPLFERIKDSYYTTRESYSIDFGHIVDKHPAGIFLLDNEDDLSTIIYLANKHKIQIAFRSQGHSTNGATLIDNGIVIDLKYIPKVSFIDKENNLLHISANATWKEALDYTLGYQLTMPVLTDYLHLSIGGTLSVGGLGGCSYKNGSQADHVESLRILTFNGHIESCSRAQNRELFEAALCGLGQVGIILDATLSLVKCTPNVVYNEFKHNDSKTFLAQQLEVYSESQVDYLKGFVRKENGNWVYVLETADFSVSESDDMTYKDFISQVDVYIKALAQGDRLDVPHAWYSILVPADKIEHHLQKTLQSPYLAGDEPILVYPIKSNTLHSPNLMKPAGETVYMLSVLFGCSFTANYPGECLVDQNMKWYKEAKDDGCTRYPIDCLPFTEEDWKGHFGEHWERFKGAKDKFDPNGIKLLV